MDLPTELCARYEAQGLLGRGGMGVVYRASQRTLARTVAIKILSGGTADDPLSRDRFVEEGRLSARIQHPNVVKVIESGQTTNGLLYLVYEFIEGDTLAARLACQGPMAADEAARVAIDILRGTAAIHEAGILHRDLKPANVVLTLSGDLKILDFGIARDEISRRRRTQTGVILGTPEYLAPEIILGHPATPAADIYAAGTILFELLVGQAPFAGGGLGEVLERHVKCEPPRLLDRVPGVSPALDALIASALSKSPGGRPASARTFAIELAEASRQPLRRTQRDRAIPAGPGTATGKSARVAAVQGTSQRMTSLVLRSTRVAVLLLLGTAATVAVRFADPGHPPTSPASASSSVRRPAQASAAGDTALRTAAAEALARLIEAGLRIETSLESRIRRLEELYRAEVALMELARRTDSAGGADLTDDRAAALLVSLVCVLEAEQAGLQIVPGAASYASRARHDVATLYRLAGDEPAAVTWEERGHGPEDRSFAAPLHQPVQSLSHRPASPTTAHTGLARLEHDVQSRASAGGILLSLGRAMSPKGRARSRELLGQALQDAERAVSGPPPDLGDPAAAGSLSRQLLTLAIEGRQLAGVLPGAATRLSRLLSRIEKLGARRLDDAGYWCLRVRLAPLVGGRRATDTELMHWLASLLEGVIQTRRLDRTAVQSLAVALGQIGHQAADFRRSGRLEPGFTAEITSWLTPALDGPSAVAREVRRGLSPWTSSLAPGRSPLLPRLGAAIADLVERLDGPDTGRPPRSAPDPDRFRLSLYRLDLCALAGLLAVDRRAAAASDLAARMQRLLPPATADPGLVRHQVVAGLLESSPETLAACAELLAELMTGGYRSFH